MARKRFLGKYDDKKIWWLRFTKDLLAFAIVMVLLFTLIIGAARVSGYSMHPTYDNGQIVVFSRLQKDYEKGDVVSIKMANGERYIKRVIAVGGDQVEIIDGVFYVNGEVELECPAHGLTEAQEGIKYPYTVKPGAYFVLGDNREVSIDSRTYGAVASTQIRGKVLF